MRLWKLWLGFAALGAAGGVVATQGKGSMPDGSRLHYERQNCHGAYDLLNADVDAGRALSDADQVWARAHEDAALAGKPCPAPPAALAKRATNRTVVTPHGVKILVNFKKQNDGAAWFESAYGVLTGAVKLPGVTPADGFATLRKAVELEDPPAQLFMGSLYITGVATGKEDYAAALPFIEKAAAAGHVDALAMAGNFYKSGVGTKADPRKAFAYYGKAAERGHVFATFMAAHMANDGEGTKKDHKLAYRLARNLADQGEVAGAVLAASALLQQRNVGKHEDEVLYWMDVALRDGDAKIKAEIGKFRPQVVAAYKRLNAPPEYRPRVWKACPMKTVCRVSHYTGIQQCTTNKDYWNDCDG
ncbi:tetratricopeptide repeat protein [Sphingomonas sp. M1-B02]|uniref:tetratricopeptide repeat protein n=1 Tax=Sphingomonas sp. M1-B02 TaxID=3114300 RepID=UPI00223EAC05|nr:tetratricopeptide repeat protein [Sphingomonas sp. S6-11]UZK65630.1 sel1 repeat family protein [Sphingomonas sp. S6-11]